MNKLCNKILTVFFAFGYFIAFTLPSYAQITNPAVSDLGSDAEAAASGETFNLLFSKGLNIIVTIAALMLLIYLLWGGIEWITAGGDKGKVEKARDKITQAIIGIIVLAAAIAVFNLIQQFLGIELIKFSPSTSTTGPQRPTGPIDVPAPKPIPK